MRCQFTAQVGNTYLGYQGNNGNINSYNNKNNAYNGNPNNANNQAMFHNDANTQVGQQVGSPNTFNNHPIHLAKSQFTPQHTLLMVSQNVQTGKLMLVTSFSGKVYP